jgi:hypothetical protein
MDNKLISSKYSGTVSDVKTTHKTAEYSQNLKFHCPSSSIKFQLKEDVSVITAQMLHDENRNNDNQETDSEFSAEDVQILKCNDSNIQMSWSAEISTKENESNSTQKISNNNNKENHASDSAETMKSSKEFLDLPVGSSQQKATDILETACKTAEVLSDERGSNDIQETDSGCNSGYLEALTRSRNKIQKSWNAEINTDENKSNSTQKFSNNINENHACNSTENFLDLPIGSVQQNETDILEAQSKTVQSWLHNSTETNLMTRNITPSEESLWCSDFSVIKMDPITIFPPASNEHTGSLTEVETPTTSTSNGTFKCRLIMNSVDENCNVAHMPATTFAKNSAEEQQESKSTAQKIIATNMETKKSKQQSDTVIYSGILKNIQMNLPKDENIPTSYLQTANISSQIDSLVDSKSYSTGLTPTLSPSTSPLNVCNSLVEEHCPAAIRRQLFAPLEHIHVQPQPTKYRYPTILLRSNQDQRKSNAELCDEDFPIRVVGIPTNICNKICPKTPHIPRNMGASINMLSSDTIPDIRNKLDIRTKLPEAHMSEITLGKPQPFSVYIPLVHDTVKNVMVSTGDSSASLLTPLQKPSAGTSVLNMTTNSISNLCDSVKVSVCSTVSAGPLMTKTISDITSPSKTSSTVACDHMTKSLSPTGAKSNSVIQPAVPCYSYENSTNTRHDSLELGTKLKRELKYQPIPNNIFNITPTKTTNLKKRTQRINSYSSATLCGVSPPLSSTDTFPSWAAKELHKPKYTENRGINTVNSIQADGAKCAERNLVRVRGRSRGRKTSGTCKVTVNTGNKKAKTKCEMQKTLYSNSYLADAMGHRYGNSGRGRDDSIRGLELVDAMSHTYGNSRMGRGSSIRGLELAMSHRYGNSGRGRGSSIRSSKLCRSNITHPSAAEQSEVTKKKHNKLKVIRHNQKKGVRTKKTCPRRTIRQGFSNNNKSLTTLCSLDMDQLCSQECLLTSKAEHIIHNIMKKRFNNRFLSKSNEEFERKTGKKTPTLKKGRETFNSASSYVPVTNNIKSNYESINNGQQQCFSETKSSLITIDCSSPGTISTENSTAVASSSFRNSEQQMKRMSEYSAPIATEYQQNLIPVSDNIYNTYQYTAYYPLEPTPQILYNDQYFPSHRNNKEEQCSAKYENIISADCSSPDTIAKENSTAVPSSSFINTEQQIKRFSEYSAPLVTEYQLNFIPVSDNIYNTYTHYPQEQTSGILYNDHYFSSHQNNEGEQRTGKYESTHMWSDIFKFNRDQEFPLEEVQRHVDQQNEYYGKSIIHNGYQNLVDETEANQYAYQLQCKIAKLNSEDLQQVQAYHHMDALSSTYNCCRSNQPTSTQNSVISQQPSEIPKLDEIQNYELSSTEINSFEGVQQSNVAINENIHNQQIICNPEHANVLPNTEMLQEELHWQKLDFYSSHNNRAIQEIYVNNEESIAHNWERHRTSGYPGLSYDDRIQLSIDSNSIFKSEGKFLQPNSQSTENFRLKKVVHLPDDIKMTQKYSKKKNAKNQRGSRRQQIARPKRIKPYVCLLCGKSEQYNAVLKRHLELHHGNSSTHE